MAERSKALRSGRSLLCRRGFEFHSWQIFYRGINPRHLCAFSECRQIRKQSRENLNNPFHFFFIWQRQSVCDVTPEQLSIGFEHRLSLIFIFMGYQLSSWPSSFRKACIIIFALTYLKNKEGEIVFLMKNESCVKFVYKYQWRVVQLWHHRDWHSCQLNSPT